MFTGIVQGVASVVHFEQEEALVHLGIELPAEQRGNLQQGASVALNGVCLTITRWDDQAVYFDAMVETLRVTNLGGLQLGSLVNFERAARFSDEIGGHLMSGHVIDQITLSGRHQPDSQNLRLDFSFAPHWQKYIFPKGYIGLNGCSLTVSDVGEGHFSVYLIPETRDRTTFGDLPIGSKVNLEIDPQTQVIVDTVERFLAQRANHD